MESSLGIGKGNFCSVSPFEFLCGVNGGNGLREVGDVLSESITDADNKFSFLIGLLGSGILDDLG